MKLPQGRQIWVWFDLVSIPQRSRDLQLVAIGSLCAYTQLCTRWFAHAAPGHYGPRRGLLQLYLVTCGIRPDPSP